MAFQTITYSHFSEGWTSFWSYEPEWMIGMNSSFYTFKGGNMYKHNSNSRRNNFYGVDYSSSITTIFNKDANDIKMFKTLEICGSDAWDANLTTDMSAGVIDYSFFQKKEDVYYGFIRRLGDGYDLDLREISAQGIGVLTSRVNTLLTFDFNIGTSISIGDTIYKVSSLGAITKIGVVSAFTANTITVASIINPAAAGDMMIYMKDPEVESYGSRGYYMEAELTNSNTNKVEIFSLATEIFKSYP
jgi:hypothetical protein